jgi:hypothetical protein
MSEVLDSNDVAIAESTVETLPEAAPAAPAATADLGEVIPMVVLSQ